MQWKNRKKALWIVVTLLVLSIVGLLIIRAQITKKQSNDYVNWFSNKISQVELQQIPIAYVGNNAIYEEDVYAYALLHSIDVAYHEGCDPEEIYQSCSVLQDSFLKLLQNEIYVVYAEEIGIEKEMIVYALDAIQSPVSLYEPVYSEGGDTLYVMDQISDRKNKEEHWLENLSLKEAMNRLGSRERHIIEMRFYEGKTQMEVADEIGISQAQVSRLEKNALKTMRNYLRP